MTQVEKEGAKPPSQEKRESKDFLNNQKENIRLSSAYRGAEKNVSSDPKNVRKLRLEHLKYISGGKDRVSHNIKPPEILGYQKK